jgi:L-threonylcarbamoyladenylate synthase
MDTQILPASQPDSLAQALAILQQGGLVAFPTDTVYGLGALARHPPSIARLYTVKDRESSKAIPILLGDQSELGNVTVDAGSQALLLAQHFWPGPLTLVLPRHSSLPEILSALPTIGVRMPNHPLALALLRLTGPLAVTSANLSGAASTVTAVEVLEQLSGRIPLILDGGRAPGGLPSTVVDCTGPELVILRQGPLSLADLYAVLQRTP